MSKASLAYWEHFEHPADVGIRGVGSSLAEAFEQAALALTAILIGPHQIARRQQIAMRCQAADKEQLLVDWLNRVIYEMATRRMIFGMFSVSIQGQKLSGTAWGDQLSNLTGAPTGEVKAASYAELKVYSASASQWIAQCVVDV